MVYERYCCGTLAFTVDPHCMRVIHSGLCAFDFPAATWDAQPELRITVESLLPVRREGVDMEP